MPQTIDAVIDKNGHIRLLENIKLDKKRRAKVIIFDDEEISRPEYSIVGSVEIIGDLESGSREISDMINKSLEKSAEQLID